VGGMGSGDKYNHSHTIHHIERGQRKRRKKGPGNKEV